MSTPFEDAYVAGLVDADGSIGLYQNGGTYVQAACNIASQDMTLIEWLCEKYDGRYQKAKACYLWKPRDIVQFITCVLPYLRTKKAQAELVLEYRGISGYNKPSQEEKAKFVLRSKELNARLPAAFRAEDHFKTLRPGESVSGHDAFQAEVSMEMLDEDLRKRPTTDTKGGE